MALIRTVSEFLARWGSPALSTETNYLNFSTIVGGMYRSACLYLGDPPFANLTFCVCELTEERKVALADEDLYFDHFGMVYPTDDDVCIEYRFQLFEDDVERTLTALFARAEREIKAVEDALSFPKCRREAQTPLRLQ